MQPMHPKSTRAMAAAYGFDASKNAEIRGSWYRLCLQAGPLPADWCHAPSTTTPLVRRSKKQLLDTVAPQHRPMQMCRLMYEVPRSA